MCSYSIKKISKYSKTVLNSQQQIVLENSFNDKCSCSQTIQTIRFQSDEYVLPVIEFAILLCSDCY